jgi:hypothetical protein
MKAYLEYKPDSTPAEGVYWVSLLIQALWQFTRNMWAYRNQIVYGVTAVEAASILLS